MADPSLLARRDLIEIEESDPSLREVLDTDLDRRRILGRRWRWRTCTRAKNRKSSKDQSDESGCAREA
jgi:hypothetical protein